MCSLDFNLLFLGGGNLRLGGGGGGGGEFLPLKALKKNTECNF